MQIENSDNLLLENTAIDLIRIKERMANGELVEQ